MATISGFDRLFLDASFLIAVYGVEDAMHARAVELLEEAETADAPYGQRRRRAVRGRNSA